jgi:dTDP-4-amino-4,6-dideoxygalactose transaminase
MIPIASPETGDRERDRLASVLDSGRFVAGEEVSALEDEFAAECGVDHGVATVNGTAALETALRAVGVGEGDRVLTTPFSFVATANAVRFCGAEPVFADVDPETFNLDPAAAESVLESQAVDAIVVVHLFGCPAEMDRFEELAAAHDVRLVEDAAQAHGASYDGRPVGSFGDAATFSFYPTKNMTTGEGGMVVTDREDVAARARRFIDHGRAADADHGYEHVALGHNFRMTEFAGALGRVQLDRLPGFVEARRDNATRLTEALADTGVTTPTEPADRRHAYNQYTVRHEDRDGLQAHLAEWGVGTKVYYPAPIHEQPAYEGYDASIPVAERLAGEVLSLPVHPALDEEAIDIITAAIDDYA